MPSVAEVIESCKNVGLDVRQNPARGGHTLWDIVDPVSNTVLTGISSHADRQGGDPNWYFNIRRMLRRAGFEIDLIKKAGRKKRPGQEYDKGKRKAKGAIDLEALAKAQAQAAAAGEHVPTLDDLDEHPEFLRRVNISGAGKVYTDDAQDQAMEAMVPRAEAPKVHYTVQRLIKILDKYGPELDQRARDRLKASGKRVSIAEGKGAKSEFVRIAIEDVAPARELRAWKSEASGQQTLHKLLESSDKAGMQLWTVALLEATMDHIEGLKWNVIDETRKKQKPEPEPEPEKPEPEPEPEKPEPEPEKPEPVESGLALEMLADLEGKVADLTETVIELATAVNNHKPTATTETMDLSIREGYATTLLELLGNFDAEKQGNHMLDLIFERLDKLAGVS